MRDVINLALDEEEACFLLALQAYGSAALRSDMVEIVKRRRQLIIRLRELGPERANQLIGRQVRVMRKAFPHIRFELETAPDGTRIDE